MPKAGPHDLGLLFIRCAQNIRPGAVHSNGFFWLSSTEVHHNGYNIGSHLTPLQVRAEKPAWYLAVISGALLRTLDFVAARSAEYLGYLEKGQLPPARLTLTAFEESFVLDGEARAHSDPYTLPTDTWNCE